MSKIEFSCRHCYTSGFEINLQFQTNCQVVSIFGPSGSGKTSILAMLAGHWNPDQGRIKVGERVLFDSRERIDVACEKRNIGLVSQEHLLFPHMNVEANLRFSVRAKPNFDQLSKTLFADVCEVLALEPILKRFPRNLSGGESQRVAIGRALMSRPDTLLLDEPLSALDSDLKSQILTYLQQIIDKLQTPVVFVSHRQADVRRLADWVVVIEQGRKVTEGHPDIALAHDRPMTWTDGVGPVNLLGIDRVVQDKERWLGVIGDQTIQLPREISSNGKVYLQFTPRDVTLSRNTDVEGLSSRNQLSGIVRRIVTVRNAAFVAVDIGQVVWAEITSHSVKELKLETGVSVICLIKTQSLQVVD